MSPSVVEIDESAEGDCLEEGECGHAIAQGGSYDAVCGAVVLVDEFCCSAYEEGVIGESVLAVLGRVP
jgi:hypothetical protein